MLLPISATAKGILWFIFFGLAKATQYTALAILGVKGWRALKEKMNRKKELQ
jgi:phosphoglycolate phosphatase